MLIRLPNLLDDSFHLLLFSTKSSPLSNFPPPFLKNPSLPDSSVAEEEERGFCFPAANWLFCSLCEKKSIPS
ncbi:hypothetical protein MRB53_029793 [Persea americana]|uniref:Uncharacterized protein n=1 Tax=Persea americana TaxID=3435 RepID=A0ACC2KJG5_PERAE|nr:hypothetical protein MRB53_029793 [Persea americana]